MRLLPTIGRFCISGRADPRESRGQPGRGRRERCGDRAEPSSHSECLSDAFARLQRFAKPMLRTGCRECRSSCGGGGGGGRGGAPAPPPPPPGAGRGGGGGWRGGGGGAPPRAPPPHAPHRSSLTERAASLARRRQGTAAARGPGISAPRIVPSFPSAPQRRSRETEVWVRVLSLRHVLGGLHRRPRTGGGEHHPHTVLVRADFRSTGRPPAPSMLEGVRRRPSGAGGARSVPDPTLRPRGRNGRLDVRAKARGTVWPRRRQVGGGYGIDMTAAAVATRFVPVRASVRVRRPRRVCRGVGPQKVGARSLLGAPTFGVQFTISDAWRWRTIHTFRSGRGVLLSRWSISTY